MVMPISEKLKYVDPEGRGTESTVFNKKKMVSLFSSWGNQDLKNSSNLPQSVEGSVAFRPRLSVPRAVWLCHYCCLPSTLVVHSSLEFLSKAAANGQTPVFTCVWTEMQMSALIWFHFVSFVWQWTTLCVLFSPYFEVLSPGQKVLMFSENGVSVNNEVGLAQLLPVFNTVRRWSHLLWELGSAEETHACNSVLGILGPVGALVSTVSLVNMCFSAAVASGLGSESDFLGPGCPKLCSAFHSPFDFKHAHLLPVLLLWNLGSFDPVCGKSLNLEDDLGQWQ